MNLIVCFEYEIAIHGAMPHFIVKIKLNTIRNVFYMYAFLLKASSMASNFLGRGCRGQSDNVDMTCG